MKKIKNFAFLLIALVCCGAMSSCEDNEKIATVLSGDWQGNFGMYYEYDYNGKIYVFDSYDTDIRFIPYYDGATSGKGEQIDYYKQGPYTYLSYRFTWHVNTLGGLELRYAYPDEELSTTIYNYRMTNDIFEGYFSNATTKFRLRKIRDYYDFTPYLDHTNGNMRGDWYNGYNPYYTRGEGELSDSTATPAEGKIVRRGNRFSDAESK